MYFSVHVKSPTVKTNVLFQMYVFYVDFTDFEGGGFFPPANCLKLTHDGSWCLSFHIFFRRTNIVFGTTVFTIKFICKIYFLSTEIQYEIY